MSLLSHILLELARRSCWRTLPISTGRTRSRAPQRTWRLAVDKLNSWRWGDLHGLRAARSIGMPLQFSLFGSSNFHYLGRDFCSLTEMQCFRSLPEFTFINQSSINTNLCLDPSITLMTHDCRGHLRRSCWMQGLPAVSRMATAMMWPCWP